MHLFYIHPRFTIKFGTECLCVCCKLFSWLSVADLFFLTSAGEKYQTAVNMSGCLEELGF